MIELCKNWADCGNKFTVDIPRKEYTNWSVFHRSEMDLFEAFPEADLEQTLMLDSGLCACCLQERDGNLLGIEVVES